MLGLPELLREDRTALRRETDRFPERGCLHVPRENLEDDTVDPHRPRLSENLVYERTPNTLPAMPGVDEEVVHGEDPAELRGRCVHRERDTDDRSFLAREEEDAREPVPKLLFDGPRDPFGSRAKPLCLDVRGD